MHGFFGSYGKEREWDLSAFADKSFIKREYKTNPFYLTQITLPKFLNDKYFFEKDDCFLAIEGVLFVADTPAKAIERYRQGETTFWDSWRGSFAGILYDERTDTLLLFNDHIGSHMLFYANTSECFSFSSDLRLLSKAIGLYNFDKTFIQTILKTGCNNNNKTIIAGIRRITAGEYILVRGEEMHIAQYHCFDNTPWSYDEARMLVNTNHLFRQAVERVVKKNEQEGLLQFYPLSGGLDSRMAQWVAHQVTKQPITNFTYSQRGHYDHLIPQEISRFLGNEWLFMPLDGGEYLTDIDRVATESHWLVNYMGPIEISTFAKQQTWEQIGVVLTGVNGDNIFATETDNRHEIARIYTQGFNGNSLGSPLVLQYYTESYSPFTDVDLLDYVLHVPTIMRRNYYFYDRWILTCYPTAANWHHKHETIGRRHKMVTIAGRNIPMKDVPKRIIMSILKRLGIYDAYRIQGDSMHPYEDWVKENPQITKTLDNYYIANKHFLQDETLIADCEEKMRIGSIMEKGKVLTILSALKAYADICEPNN